MSNRTLDFRFDLVEWNGEKKPCGVRSIEEKEAATNQAAYLIRERYRLQNPLVGEIVLADRRAEVAPLVTKIAELFRPEHFQHLITTAQSWEGTHVPLELMTEDEYRQYRDLLLGLNQLGMSEAYRGKRRTQ